MLPLILGSAFAVLLLVIIHFFGLRLRQKLDFSHLQFLKTLISRTSSVRKINNYLLLLVRTLFVVSALAAFLLYDSGGSSNSSANSKVVVDTSWSMQSDFSANLVTKAEKAQQDARAIANSSPRSKSSNLAQPSQGDKFETEPDFSTAQELLNQIDHEGRNSQVYLLSDFQKSAFTTEVLKSLPKEQAVYLVPYSSSQNSNLFIDSVWLQVPILLPGKQADVAVRVAESLLENEKQVKVSASEGGKLVGATQVLLKHAQKATLYFKIPLNELSEKQIVFTVEDEETSFDNQFHVVLPKPAAIKIKLEVAQADRHPVVNAYKAETGFQIIQNPIADANVFVLEMREGSRKTSIPSNLKSWVSKGGTLLLIPSAGDQTALLQVLADLGLKGISEEAKDVPAKLLRQPDLSDAFFKSIFEKEVKNMRMPALQPSLTWKSAPHTILSFQDNTPFLSSFNIENGKVHLFSAPLTGSAFATHPLFVPVMYQLVLAGRTHHSVLAHQPVDRTISVLLANNVPSKQPYMLKRNGQEFVPDQKVVQNQLVMTLPAELHEPGFYELTREGQEVQQLAINIPKAESELESYSVEELQNLVDDLGENIQVLEREGDISWQKQVQKEGNTSSLWKYCLILCFLCLMVEALILSTKKRGSLIQSGYHS